MVSSPSETVMPFDHAATFELKGIPGNIIQDVINISSDGTFVAVAIGYGFEEDRARPVTLLDLSPPSSVVLAPSPTSSTVSTFAPAGIFLEQIPVDALVEGFRLNPEFDRLVFDGSLAGAGNRRGGQGERALSTGTIDNGFGQTIVQRLKPAEEISFLFSIVDSGTGRELQDEPIHNLASLGKSNGERPFRMLAQPLAFQPRSTIRLQIVERSVGIRGTLFIVLYGYKTFGGGARPPSVQPFTPATQLTQAPSPRVIPFDYVASLLLTGSPGNRIEKEIPINAEGGFVVTSIGYGLGVETLDVPLKKNTETVNLSELLLTDFPSSALQDGIRIRPGFARVALLGPSLLNGPLSLEVANRVFERMNRVEDVSFRYSLFDGGSGREMQNQPINNVAGLGIANGDRPFKKLVRPMMFLPRSTIRINVEERFGRGPLHIVFQGYKLLSTPMPTQEFPQPRRARR